MSSYDPGSRVERSLYAIVLSKDDEAPNLPKSDFEEIKSDSKDESEKKKKSEH